MLDLNDITPLILTWNEEPNIARTLERLDWARRIVVVDSGSSDGTLEILQRFPQIEVHSRTFDDHTRQWNFGLQQVESEWVLALDADYIVPRPLVEELRALTPDPAEGGFFARFRYVSGGRLLRNNLYPPREVLFRRQAASFVQDGHTQRVQVEGAHGWLKTPILHDDRKPLQRWLIDQARYSAAEADKLLTTPWGSLPLQDRIRRTGLLGPPAVMAYCLFGKGLFLDGWPGWLYVLQRTIAEAILSVRLVDRRLQ